MPRCEQRSSLKNAMKSFNFPANTLIPTLLVFVVFTVVELNTIWYSFTVLKRIIIMIFVIFENFLLVVVIIRPTKGTDQLSRYYSALGGIALIFGDALIFFCGYAGDYIYHWQFLG